MLLVVFVAGSSLDFRRSFGRVFSHSAINALDSAAADLTSLTNPIMLPIWVINSRNPLKYVCPFDETPSFAIALLNRSALFSGY